MIGGGIVSGASTQCGYFIPGNFSTDAAQAALDNGGAVYGYWFLLGPAYYNNCAGASTLAEAQIWGQQQAQAAITALSNYPQINRKTIFGDVEAGSWSSDTSLNQAVITGFIQGVQNAGYIAGIYSAPCAWSEITGSYNLPNGVVTWTYEFSYSSPPACPTTFSPESNAACGSQYNGPQGFGGIAPNIWQYYQSSTTDLDVANALPS
ncbi:hypothetical protein TPY_1536 [Sulfobacillus acidophilus TPY]|nr:hypothetical protein TPY_1536 [Sulfobacillus acidophilus TPY]